MYNIYKRGEDIKLVKWDEELPYLESNIIILEGSKYDIIFQNETLGYHIVDRQSEIDYLYDIIGQSSLNDKNLIKSDIKELEAINDEFIFSSFNSNDYVSATNNKKEFIELCETLLAIYNNLD